MEIDRPRRFRWRRRYALLLGVAALAADYGSPAALWTAAIPLLFMAALLIFRERLAALAVLFLSSWIGIPTAAGLSWGLDAIQGRPRLLVVSACTPAGGGSAECSAHIPGVVPGTFEDCLSHRFELDDLRHPLPHGPLGLLRQNVTESFAYEHNTLALWSASTRGESCDDRAQWVVLSEREASRLRSPCSRFFTADLVGAWQPDPRDIARAEAALPAAIAAGFARLAAPVDASSRPPHYHRQYAGFLRGGERVLYLNAVAHVDRGDNRFRDEALMRCDGGTSSFGAVFDPAKGFFDSFEFNAGLGGRLPLK
jgi:hypothetical protein